MKKQNLCLAFTLALALQASTTAWAAAPISAQLMADSRAAQSRYNSDKKLCNDETTSSARLQCRRDAKSDYDQAIATAKAKAATTHVPMHTAHAAPVATAAQTAPACAECGRVMSVGVTEKAGEYSAVGVIAGGALGAVLGNQVGGGVGKDLATLAGAAGGAYAGKVIEEKIKTHKVWSVTVVYGNESRASFDFLNDPGFQVGDRVKNSGNTITRQ